MSKKLIKKLDELIDTHDADDDYTIGIRNGLILARSIVDKKEPIYKKIPLKLK